MQVVPNKRGRVPPSAAMLLPGFPVVAHRDASSPHTISLDVTADAFEHIRSKATGELILPTSAASPKDRVVSRFLGKMAVEAMALRLLEHPEGLLHIVDDPQLDPIRNYARRGHPQEWPHNARRIYDAERRIADLDGKSYQTVHEFDFLVTDQQEWYFIFALFGLELTINLGGPEIDGYLKWLDEHDGNSPLYSGKNAK